VVSPWSLTSTSDSATSCPSSMEVKEFYYDDDVVDAADWNSLMLTGSDQMSPRDSYVTCESSADGYVTTRHVRPATASQDAAINTRGDTADGGAGWSGLADKTLTAAPGRCCRTV